MLTAHTLTQMVRSIVKNQESIIGPLALEQANRVPGISVSSSYEVIVKGDDPKKLLSLLVSKYEALFGQTSVEVCKDAVRELSLSVSPSDLPSILQ